MKTNWDLDVNVVTFSLSDENIECQHDNFPIIFDLDRSGDVVEIEVILPVRLEDLKRILSSRTFSEETINTILFMVSSANMRALMFGTPTIPQSPWVADPHETTVREFQPA